LLQGAPDASVQRVSTDSRQVRAGDLFVALRGAHCDGHQFVSAAAAQGAVAALVRSEQLPQPWPACALLAVEDPRRALGRLAAAYRADFALPLIAVGGSNGKTTTKDLLASVLRQRLDTLASPASFNNDLGVPLTLLQLEATHQVAVVEVGTNHPGELAPLVRMVRPRLGVLTNIAREHLEFLGDLAGVAAEEGWLAELLPAEGALFLQGDSDWAEPIARRTAARVIRVGLGPANDWRARDVRLSQTGVTFRVEAPRAAWSGEYRLQLLGRHQVLNALLALAVGAEFGVSRAEMARGLATMPIRIRSRPPCRR